ncbi:M56 family metallopeptidase [Rubripirellula reticaptiva]|uniref:Regulatory protein BlaR1 n=1 Tax=Rubripirellula reticaptiva TaxID=2528013 RepID=A0A5C6ETJ6_9BACT|nr:M56 family metallopeptidase [Rubripirellula reticaptiva]TWU51407.1 Regulatory protein BlaR1 [Rubripirellula reticaptiva]
MSDPEIIIAVATGVILYTSGILVCVSLLETLADDTKFACWLWTLGLWLSLVFPIVLVLIPSARIEFAKGPGFLNSVAEQNGIDIVLLSVWGIGTSIVAALRLSARCLLSRWIRSTCCDLADDELTQIGRIVPELSVATRIVATNASIGPFCYSQGQCTIVLPCYLLNESDQVIRHTILHEIAHFQHEHPRQLRLQNLCTAVYWFHPVVWWAARRADLAREYLCDEVVVRSEGDVANYLRSLATVAQRSTERDRQEDGLGISRRSSLVRRSKRLVQLAGRNNESENPWRKYAALIVLVILVAAITIWAYLALIKRSLGSVNQKGSCRGEFSFEMDQNRIRFVR